MKYLVSTGAMRITAISPEDDCMTRDQAAAAAEQMAHQFAKTWGMRVRVDLEETPFLPTSFQYEVGPYTDTASA